MLPVKSRSRIRDLLTMWSQSQARKVLPSMSQARKVLPSMLCAQKSWPARSAASKQRPHECCPRAAVVLAGDRRLVHLQAAVELSRTSQTHRTSPGPSRSTIAPPNTSPHQTQAHLTVAEVATIALGVDPRIRFEAWHRSSPFISTGSRQTVAQTDADQRCP